MSRLVLKLGGRVAAASVSLVRERHAAGDDVVVVHGAGPQISAELERRGLPVRFVDGRRFTDAETLEVVRASLLDVGAGLVQAIGRSAVQLVGDEIGLRARPLPVVTPVAVGPLNVNADEAASALAVGLAADRILFVSDVPGVYVEGEVAERLHVERASELLAEGAFEGGIVPKLLAAVRAARLGVRAEIGVTEVLA